MAEFKVGDRVRVRLAAFYGSISGAKGVIVDSLPESCYLEFLPDDLSLRGEGDDQTYPCVEEELEHLPEGE